jgi:hypothetical protein
MKNLKLAFSLTLACLLVADMLVLIAAPFLVVGSLLALVLDFSFAPVWATLITLVVAYVGFVVLSNLFQNSVKEPRS